MLESEIDEIISVYSSLSSHSSLKSCSIDIAQYTRSKGGASSPITVSSDSDEYVEDSFISGENHLRNNQRPGESESSRMSDSSSSSSTSSIGYNIPFYQNTTASPGREFNPSSSSEQMSGSSISSDSFSGYSIPVENVSRLHFHRSQTPYYSGSTSVESDLTYNENHRSHSRHNYSITNPSSGYSSPSLSETSSSVMDESEYREHKRRYSRKRSCQSSRPSSKRPKLK